MFTIRATWAGSVANCEKRLAVSIKNGAPGAWPTSNLQAEMTNSGQSHRLVVGSAVAQYNMAVRQKTAHAIIVLTCLNDNRCITQGNGFGSKSSTSRPYVMPKRTYIILTSACQQCFSSVSSTSTYSLPLRLTIRSEDCPARDDFIRLMNV